MTDVLVVGGGVIGLSIAYELAGQGASVRVLERGEFGREASWAGAGILHPGNRKHALTAEAQLRSLSAERWPELTRELWEETGIDNGFVNCGGIEIAIDESPEDDGRTGPLVAQRRCRGRRTDCGASAAD